MDRLTLIAICAFLMMLCLAIFIGKAIKRHHEGLRAKKGRNFYINRRGET